MNILLGAFVTMSAFIIGKNVLGKFHVRVVLQPNNIYCTTKYCLIEHGRFNLATYDLALSNGSDLVQSVIAAGRSIAPNLNSMLQNGENIYYT